MEDIEYGIIEQNGSISFIKRGDGSFAHPLIIDGEYIKSQRKSEEEISDIVSRNGLSIEEVFLMTVDDDDKINIIEKEGK